ncbi:hypothetical protein MLD38_033473 [Melastoma candidum]|uniref:Uncharacterized protein n=1 Tax=Melastoma candidum TaxID=119954 RepID=A0ACB9M8Z6_9MYRT|nr:hypothetical protein MLD38_033473 [Melastoma candidum]
MAEEKKQEEAKSVEKAEEKKEEKAEEKKEEAKPEEKKEDELPKPPPPFVLRVDLHCVGCAKKISRSIMRIRGVVGVDIDMEKNELTIKGVVEPQAVCDKIAKKTKRKAQVISPLPPAEGEPLPQVVASQVSEPTTVELNVNMHCDACAEQLRSKILKMRGVQKVETDLSVEKVTVTGTMDVEKLVDYIRRRTKKQAKVIPQPEPDPKPEVPPENPENKPAAAEEGGEANKGEVEKAKEEEGVKKEEVKATDTGKEAEPEPEAAASAAAAVVYEDEMGMKMMTYYYQPLYMIERLPPPPQLFSDENPNACSIS